LKNDLHSITALFSNHYRKFCVYHFVYSYEFELKFSEELDHIPGGFEAGMEFVSRNKYKLDFATQVWENKGNDTNLMYGA
jgi:hypothetical protein